MKTYISIAAFLLLSAAEAAAQAPSDSVTLGSLKLNFVVPDAPAFKALSSEPSNLLRPSTPQAFAVSFSEFYQNRALVLPRDFAVEVTPSLLLNADKKLNDVVARYSTPRNRVLNSFRVSVGTAAGGNGLADDSRSLAVGARINLINRGDLATDQSYLRDVVAALGGFRVDATRELAVYAHGKGVDTTAVDWDIRFLADPENKVAFDTYLADEKQSAGQAAFLQKLDSIKTDYKKRNWNAMKWDAAIAALGTSPDSLVGNLRFARVAAWSTVALPAGKNGQLLVGMRASAYKDAQDTGASRENFYGDFSLPARLLFGTNRVKGFAEAQYSYTGDARASAVLLNLGAEVCPLDGVWLHLYGGVDNARPRNGEWASAFIASLRLKVTLPERFRFF